MLGLYGLKLIIVALRAGARIETGGPPQKTTILVKRFTKSYKKQTPLILTGHNQKAKVHMV